MCSLILPRTSCGCDRDTSGASCDLSLGRLVLLFVVLFSVLVGVLFVLSSALFVLFSALFSGLLSGLSSHICRRAAG